MEREFGALERCDVYAMESVTSFFAYLNGKYPEWRVVGSEFMGPDIESGTYIDGIRHEAVESLSFVSESLDLIVSNDVFEHVPDLIRGLGECARVLRPGGRLSFTIPFHYRADSTVRRARINNGVVEHLADPVYHGNPVSEDGSLVFHDIGWDVLDICRTAGFRDAYVLSYYGLEYGYVGDSLQLMLVAEK